MGLYDNFVYDRPRATKIGKNLINYRNKFFLKKILSYSNRNITILEIGPGKGDFAELCTSINLNYIGIEGSKTLYSNLLNKGVNVYYQFVPPLKIDKDVDVIYMNQVFEHMQNINMAGRLLDDCNDILNNNGLIVISCPEIKFCKEDFFAFDYTHCFPTSLTNVSQILFDHGFEVLDKGYYTLWFENKFTCAVISKLTRFIYGLGVFDILLKKRAYKTKIVLLPSFYILARKNGK